MPSQTDNPRADRWPQALAAGLQAAAWWLVAALIAGAIAGLAVLAGHVSGVASLAMSALSLAYLLDLMRSAGAFFGQADTL